MALVAVLAVGGLSCESDSDSPLVDFVIAVGDETFVLRVADPDAIATARANLRGENRQFPVGPLLRGHGGFNSPWSWRFDPDRARFAEVAIEVCDGRPSYVESHLATFLATGYCPWSARVVAVKP